MAQSHASVDCHVKGRYIPTVTSHIILESYIWIDDANHSSNSKKLNSSPASRKKQLLMDSLCNFTFKPKPIGI